MPSETASQTPGLTKDEFFKAHGLSDADLAYSGTSWEELVQIRDQYRTRMPTRQDVADMMATSLGRLPRVHSVRMRLKSEDHLMEKVVRKRKEARDKGEERAIHVGNFEDQISDLIGVRILHLYKQDWQSIHESLIDEYAPLEKPTAYVRKGDSEYATYVDAGCEVKEHGDFYRSVHYIVSERKGRREYRAEIQVRTIFEEGWSEVDHHVRYPRHSDSPLLGECLRIFNRLAGSADELASFILRLRNQHFVETALRAESEEQKSKLAERQRENENLRRSFNAEAMKVAKGDAERMALERRLKAFEAGLEEERGMTAALARNGAMTALFTTSSDPAFSHFSHFADGNEEKIAAAFREAERAIATLTTRQGHDALTLVKQMEKEALAQAIDAATRPHQRAQSFHGLADQKVPAPQISADVAKREGDDK